MAWARTATRAPEQAFSVALSSWDPCPFDSFYKLDVLSYMRDPIVFGSRMDACDDGKLPFDIRETLIMGCNVASMSSGLPEISIVAY